LTVIFLFCLFFFQADLYANNKLISFGDVQIGADRINLIIDDFKVNTEQKSNIPIRANLIADSVQWVRDQSNLLIPRARLQIDVGSRSATIVARYIDEVVIPEKTNKGSSFDLYVNLFNPGTVEIKKGTQIIGEVGIRVDDISDKIKARNQKTKLIDYSCSRYRLEFKGLEHEYMSIGCKLQRIKIKGIETPRLVVTWSTTNYSLLDDSIPPFKVILHGNDPATIIVKDRNGKNKKITISANLPKRLHRLKTAFGFGPYMFEPRDGDESRNQRVAPALMFYGRYDLLKTTSLRFFNATVASGSLFNNGGLYFAYELADAFDGRLELVPLLGAQILSFDYDDEKDAYHKAIYPQGAELVWNNAFNVENYLVVYGMFLSTSSQQEYQNLWIRWGKKYFWELNYINWEQDGLKAKMWGLSIGLPLFQAF
jgi:hypothetical protein